MKEKTLEAYNIADLREIALRRVPKGMFEFVDRGTEDEVALRSAMEGAGTPKSALRVFDGAKIAAKLLLLP